MVSFRHNSDVNDSAKHLSLHDPFIIAEKTNSAAQHVGGGAGIYICIANRWMLLNILRS